MFHDPTQPDKPGSLIVASRKTSFLLSFPLAAQLEPVSPSTPRGSPIDSNPDLPSLTSTSTGSLDLSSEQLGILTAPLPLTLEPPVSAITSDPPDGHHLSNSIYYLCLPKYGALKLSRQLQRLLAHPHLRWAIHLLALQVYLWAYPPFLLAVLNPSFR
ncbi:uncharacterized protein EI90DRAFT_3132776 [Cantharellus anzutake]|uniref:uncharacterized protein n=1 Tax=Cantharellus anzutake TaxID=1750568 RepID=UPI00190590B4|nr:uncharacterized protein EI90DRAFT_3132776 [Cantharellus anzutake]KAF8319189.1 hypothetical protein EI90DRAFT_3132776 [Cantharellus anzutake]